jgi:pimeloyl-ACP methyl ester carboxylesterase
VAGGAPAYRERRFTTRDGLSLYFRDYGDAAGPRPPVVCLGGLTRNSKDFEDLAPRIAATRRVLCLDYRGRGRSDYDPDPRRYAAETYVADVLELLAATDAHPVVVIGTSLGGLVAMGVAVARPTALAGGGLALIFFFFPPVAQTLAAMGHALEFTVTSFAIFFAGLFDEQGQRWAQTDERPLGSLYPPSAWPVGVGIRTPLRIPVPVGTPPGRYRLEVGWYRFVDGQPIWLPWTGGERLALDEVDVVAPEDWRALPLPEVAQPIDVTIGQGIRFLGFDAPMLASRPGETLSLDLYWQALDDAPEAGVPEPGLAVLQLTDEDGNVLAESSSAPAGGRAPFVRL